MAIDYGTDLDMADLDFAADGGTVSGVELLKQAVLIRLSTPRGSVIDAPDDGIALEDWLSKAMSPSDVASLQGTIEAEILKDERFAEGGSARATVDASTLLVDQSFSVTLDLDAGEGPFHLVLSVGAAGVAIAGGA